MTDQNDNKLRQLFQEQRRTDAQRAPAFDRVLRDARRVRPVETPVFPMVWLRLAAAALLLAALGVSLAVIHARRRETMPVTVAMPPAEDTQQWSALSNWSAPTDGLLTLSSTAVWGSKITTPTDTLIESTNETGSSQSDERGTL
jgi:hypothetical protein